MNKKPNSVWSMIAIEIAFLYLAVYMGDFFRISGLIPSEAFTRYIPVVVLAIILTFILTKSRAKRTFSSDRESFIKKLFIIPVIIAVIIFVYGLYSLHSNVSQMEKSLKTFSSISSSASSKLYSDMLNQAKNNAIISWLITSLAYLIPAEIVTFLMQNKLDELMIADYSSPVMNQTDTYMNGNHQTDSNLQNNYNYGNDKSNENDPVKKIKWDL